MVQHMKCSKQTKYVILVSFIVLLIGCAEKKVINKDAIEPLSGHESIDQDGIKWELLNKSVLSNSVSDQVEIGDFGKTNNVVSFKRRHTATNSLLKHVALTVEEIDCSANNYRILSGELTQTLADGSKKHEKLDGSLIWKPISPVSVGTAGLKLAKDLCSR